MRHWCAVLFALLCSPCFIIYQSPEPISQVHLFPHFNWKAKHISQITEERRQILKFFFWFNPHHRSFVDHFSLVIVQRVMKYWSEKGIFMLNLWIFGFQCQMWPCSSRSSPSGVQYLDLSLVNALFCGWSLLWTIRLQKLWWRCRRRISHSTLVSESYKNVWKNYKGRGNSGSSLPCSPGNSHI